MASVGKQRYRMRNNAVEHLDRNQPLVKGGCNREHRPKIISRVPVVMAVMVVHWPRHIASDSRLHYYIPNGFTFAIKICQQSFCPRRHNDRFRPAARCQWADL